MNRTEPNQHSHQVSLPIQSSAGKVGRRLFLAGLVLTASGCQNMIKRGQSPDGNMLSKYSQKKHDGPRYVRDVCGIFGLDYKKVHGIGLAVDLDGTGSAPLESGQREHLVKELRKNRDIEDIENLLKSTSTELVIVEGKLPPGIQAGDTFDLEVVTMHASEAESLANGMLVRTELRPMVQLGRGMERGNISGMARGRVLINSLFDARKDKESDLHGVILGGGKATEDRPLGLRIQSSDFNQKTTTEIQLAINSRFTMDSSLGRDGVATAKTDRLINLKVPTNYKHNIGRYVSVIHHMAFAEKTEDRKKRIIDLGRELSDPSQAGLAALKLEGLGRDGEPVLQQALKHADLEVRFRAAEALAYLGSAEAVEVLELAAREEPAFRWHAFAALSSLDETSATNAIKNLLHVQSAETRYGAFQALLAQSPSDPIVNGKWLAGDFYLHQVQSDAEPMIHFSRVKRPEIVVFNADQAFADHLLFVTSGLTVQANGNKTITIKRYSVEFGNEAETCSTRVVDVLELLGELGVGYSEQLKFLREAKDASALPGRLVVNATPKLGRSIARGRDELEPEKSKRYVNTSLPELFRTHKNSADQESIVAAEDEPSQPDAEPETKKPTAFAKMKSWFTIAK